MYRGGLNLQAPDFPLRVLRTIQINIDPYKVLDSYRDVCLRVQLCFLSLSRMLNQLFQDEVLKEFVRQIMLATQTLRHLFNQILLSY